MQYLCTVYLTTAVLLTHDKRQAANMCTPLIIYQINFWPLVSESLVLFVVHIISNLFQHGWGVYIIALLCYEHPPSFPQRTACNTFQDLCICVQALPRWKRWLRRCESGPFQTVAFDSSTCAYGSKVVISHHLQNAAIFDFHMRC